MKEYNNFTAIFSILSGLENTAVSRLKKTWKNVPKKQLSDFSAFQNQFRIDDNYSDYRKLLQEQDLPIVPFLGIMHVFILRCFGSCYVSVCCEWMAVENKLTPHRITFERFNIY